jgi:exonuclease SbcC
MTARLLSLSARGFGALADVSVDLSTLASPLVAVCGANGAGKSTLLECFAALIYRRFPTRGDGTLKSLATRRDACLSGRVQAADGETYTIRHLVDGTSGASEATVTRADGSHVVHSGKVTEFDAWAKVTFPPENVFLASAFAAQGSAQFLGMKAADRKGVLLRVLGIERLERQAERARERAREAKGRIDLAEAGLAPILRQGADDVAALEEAVVDARAALAAAELDAELMAKALDEARDADARATAAEAERGRLADAWAAAKARAEAADRKRADVETKLANNRKVLENAENIRAAVVRAADYTRQIGAAEAARERWEADSANAVLKANQARWKRDAASMAIARMADPSSEIARLERETVAENEERLAAARAALEDAQSQEARIASGAANARLLALRTGLTRITMADTLDFAKSTAHATIIDDESAAEARAERPAVSTWEATERVKAAEMALHLRTVRYAELLAKRAEREAKATEVAALEATIAEIESGIRPDPCPDLASLRASRQRAQELADLAPRVEAAESRIQELNGALAEAMAELDAAILDANTAGHAYDALAPIVRPDLAGARAQMASQTALVTKTQRDLATAEERLANAKRAADEAATLREARALATQDAQRWGRLAADIGKDGLQALEIDAAGPALTVLVNDLLNTCLGSRFAVTIETQRASADGKRQIEGCDVLVTDRERGRTDRAETFSGGERVLIGEAVSLALTMLAARRLGSGATLVRDESGAALSPENGRAYVAMLRRAAVLARADRVLFVTHNADLAALADDRIDL